MNFIQSIDVSILHSIHNTLSCGFLDFLMPLITHLGDVGAIWVIIGIIMIITKKYRKYGIILLCSLVLCFVAGNVIIKPLVARPRPFLTESGINLLIKSPSGYSFPSGHTLASVAGATVLTLTNKKFAIWAVPVCLLISFSRLYLYVHYPSDVLASVFLGIVIGIISFVFGKKIIAKIEKHRSKNTKNTAVKAN